MHKASSRKSSLEPLSKCAKGICQSGCANRCTRRRQAGSGCPYVRNKADERGDNQGQAIIWYPFVLCNLPSSPSSTILCRIVVVHVYRKGTHQAFQTPFRTPSHT